MVEDLASGLTEEGFHVRLEVPNMGQYADLAAAKDDEVFLIEAKIRDWRRALEQCIAHEIVADYVCVAIGSVKVSPALAEQAEDSGYGVIHCRPGSDPIWAVRPRKNPNTWKPQRAAFFSTLKELDDEC